MTTRGRPKKNIDPAVLQELTKKGYTFQQIADSIGSSKSYLEKTWSKQIHEWRKEVRVAQEINNVS